MKMMLAPSVLPLFGGGHAHPFSKGQIAANQDKRDQKSESQLAF
jgi:hypothetical protein